MLRIFFIATALALAIPASADMKLKPIHPDEPVEYTYNKRFSINNALDSTSRIRLALESFRKLTEISEGKISKEKMHKIGNTDWERQNLGFNNWPGVIEGTLHKSHYVIKKLQYELMMERVKAGKLEASHLEKAEKEFKQSEQQFLKFWNASGVRD